MKKILAGCGIALVVLVVGGALAILALSKTIRQARSRAMEITAAHQLRAYAEAQKSYREFLKKNGKPESYAPTVSILSETRDSDGREFMDPYMARTADGSEYGGYAFRELKSLGGKAIDWKSDFAVCAAPVANIEGGEGTRLLVITTDGKIWQRQCELAPGFPEDFPSDPAKSGWKPYDSDKDMAR